MMAENIPSARKVLTTRTRFKVLNALNSESPKSKANEYDLTERKKCLHSRIVDEIITTEKSYLHHLATLVQFFMKPLHEKALLSPKEFNVIFGPIESIRQVNSELLSRLEERRQSVGMAFLELAPYLRMYCSYANNFKEASALIQKLEKNKEFTSFKQSQESRPEVNMKLNALLITPIQRIPRYKLLLEELLQNTLPESEDFKLLEDAVEGINNVASQIDECVREYDNIQKMLSIQRSLTGGRPRIVIPGRIFVKEGLLMKVSRKGDTSHERMFFLFSDMLMYCKLHGGSEYGRPDSLTCCCILPVKHCSVESLFDCGTKHGSLLKLTCKGEEFLLYTDNVEDGDSWLQAIRATVRRFCEYRQTLRKESSAKGPTRRAALKRQKIESLSRLSQQRRRAEALQQISPNDCAVSRDTFFMMTEILKTGDCFTPLKKAKLEEERVTRSTGSPPERKMEGTSCNRSANLATLHEISKESLVEAAGDALDHFDFSGESNSGSQSGSSSKRTNTESSSSSELVRMKSSTWSLISAKSYFRTTLKLREATRTSTEIPVRETNGCIFL